MPIRGPFRALSSILTVLFAYPAIAVKTVSPCEQQVLATVDPHNGAAMVATAVTSERTLRPGSAVDLVHDTQEKINSLKSANRESAIAVLKSEFTKYYRINLVDVDSAEFKRDAKQIIEGLFYARLDLRDRVHRFTGRDGHLDPEILQWARRLNSALRSAEDHVGEIMVNHAVVDDKNVKKAFEDLSPWTVINPQVGKLDITSGDVFISRGKAAVSAAIARIGDEDYQFSHMAFFYNNPEDGQWYVPEAIIEKGLINHGIDHALNGPARMAIYRLRPSAMRLYPELNMTSTEFARQSAKLVFDKAKETKDGGDIYPYNFTMALEPYNQLFCTQAVRMGFDLASNGAMKLPTELSKLSQRNRDFIERIGVTVTETFAPGDIEFDPRFELIAEWRDFRITPKIRLFDYVLTSIYQWMERDGWRFVEPLWVTAAVNLAKSLTESRFSWLRALPGLFGAEIPPYMTTDVMATMILLHQTAHSLYAVADRFYQNTLERTGFPPAPRQIYAFLEEYKKRNPNGIKYLKPPR